MKRNLILILAALSLSACVSPTDIDSGTEYISTTAASETTTALPSPAAESTPKLSLNIEPEKGFPMVYDVSSIYGSTANNIDFGYQFIKNYGDFYWNYVLGGGWEFDFNDTIPGEYDYDEKRRVQGSDFNTYTEYLERINTYCSEDYFQDMANETTGFTDLVYGIDDKIYVGETFAYTKGIVFADIYRCEVYDETTVRFFGGYVIYHLYEDYDEMSSRVSDFWFEMKLEDGIWKLNDSEVAPLNNGIPFSFEDIACSAFLLNSHYIQG
jgi:hypothetical protein